MPARMDVANGSNVVAAIETVIARAPSIVMLEATVVRASGTMVVLAYQGLTITRARVTTAGFWDVTAIQLLESVYLKHALVVTKFAGHPVAAR